MIKRTLIVLAWTAAAILIPYYVSPFISELIFGDSITDEPAFLRWILGVITLLPPLGGTMVIYGILSIIVDYIRGDDQ